MQIQQETSSYAPAVPSCGERSVEPVIEDYLDHVCAPLVGHVPYARRQTLRSELAEHLDALIEAREELGETHEDAVQQALRQFGDPATLGRQWLREWEGAQGPSETMWEAGRLGMRYFAPAGLIGLAVMSLLQNGPGRFSLPLVGVIIPAGAAFVTGFRSRRWAMVAAGAGVGSVTLLSALLALSFPQETGESTFAALAIVGFFLWMPVSCVLSELGALARRRLSRRSQLRRARQA